MHTKTFNAVVKNGFNPVLGSIPRLPFFISINIKYQPFTDLRKICDFYHLKILE